MAKKHKAGKTASLIDVEIAVLEQQIETTYASLLLDGLGPEYLRFVSIFTVLADYAAQRTPCNAIAALAAGGMAEAGLSLLLTVWGDKACRPARLMLMRWQTGTPARQADLRAFLNGIIPEQGIRLTHPNGRVEHLTRGAFARGEVQA